MPNNQYLDVMMTHNALGKTVTPMFEIDVFQVGFDELCQIIDRASTQTNAQVVLLIKPFTVLAQELRADA